MNGYWVAMQGVLKYRSAALSTPTVLLVSFPGGSTADQSPANNGTATETGTITLSNGSFSATLVSSEAREISWSSADFRIDGGPLTIDFIVRADAIAPDPPTASFKLARFVINSADVDDRFDIQMNGVISAENNIAIQRQTGVGSSAGATGTEDSMGRNIHVALVFREAGTFDYYIEGVRYTPADNNNPFAHANNAILYLGGLNQSTQETTVTVYYARITQAEVFTGASFTPPTELGLYYP